jgi:hypothetical protein
MDSQQPRPRQNPPGSFKVLAHGKTFRWGTVGKDAKLLFHIGSAGGCH